MTWRARKIAGPLFFYAVVALVVFWAWIPFRLGGTDLCGWDFVTFYPLTIWVAYKCEQRYGKPKGPKRPRILIHASIPLTSAEKTHGRRPPIARLFYVLNLIFFVLALIVTVTALLVIFFESLVVTAIALEPYLHAFALIPALAGWGLFFAFLPPPPKPSNGNRPSPPPDDFPDQGAGVFAVPPTGPKSRGAEAGFRQAS